MAMEIEREQRRRDVRQRLGAKEKMGTIRSVAGWAIVAACGCSTAQQETDIKGSGITTLSTTTRSATTRGETTENNYFAVDATSDVDSDESTSSGETSGEVDTGDAGDGTSEAANTDTIDETDGETDGETHAPADSSEADTSEAITTGQNDSTSDESVTGSPTTDIETEPTNSNCRDTAGLCDPTGECAKSECNFERTGKTCGYTPERTYPFMCVITANYEPYRPCDSDDVCAPGSVCISQPTFFRDGSFYKRSAPVCQPTCSEDADCGEGEWCQQATDDNNQELPDLKVCHRHCTTEADCYVGEGDDEVRCSESQAGAPPSSYECSRYSPFVSKPEESETTADATSTNSSAPVDSAPVDSAPADSTNSGLSSGLALQALSVRGAVMSCVVARDCEAGYDCVDYQCAQRCETSADCDGAECQFVEGRGACGAVCDKPEGAECGLLPTNCGCDAGETCQLGADLKAACGAPGPNPAMAWCNDSSDCSNGLSCVAGLCRPLCDPEGDGCEPGEGECVLSVSTTDGDIHACAGYCDPVESPSCGTGAVCLPGFDSQLHHHALCASESPAQAPHDKGGECKADYDCKTGLGCDAAGTCQAWCRTDDDCATGRSCALDASILGHDVGRFGSSPSDAVGLCQASR